MQVDTPHHAPSTFQEFVRQYAMVVLSILTALALEHLVVGWHDAATARASRARIDAELQRNLVDLKAARKTNAENVDAVKAAVHALVDLLRKPPVDNDVTMKTIKPALDHFGISVAGWQRDAWDAAIADQSASHMESADLRRYAEISEHDMETEASLLLGGEWLTRASELLVDVRLGKVDARLITNQMVRYLVAAEQIEAEQIKLEKLLAGHIASQVVSATSSAILG